MINIKDITSNLVQREDGIWVAQKQSHVSYPIDGNETCFALEDRSFWFRHRNSVICQLVSRFSPSAVFFDIGGGNGCVSKALQSKGFDTVLVEPGANGAVNARSRGLRTVIQSTLQDAVFSSQSMASVGLFDVVEHIEDDIGFMRTIWDCLQPDGTVYMTVPALQFLWSKDDAHAGHFRRYTKSSLSILLTQCGFDIRYCGFLFSFLIPPIFLFRSVPSWLGFRNLHSTETIHREHSSGIRIANYLIQKLLRYELNIIKKGKSMIVGSSCVAVAVKKT
tara:strand:+ start:696 stop:1529 length:834 start_codon:yes stop_codon:yes gene_type:complete